MEPPLPSQRLRALAPALLYGLVALVLIAQAGVASAPRIGAAFPGFMVWDNGVIPAQYRTSWTGPQTGLPLNGAVVVAVDGEPFAGGQALQRYVAARPIGTPVLYRVRIDGVQREVVVPTMILGAWDYATTLGLYLLLAISFLGVGVVALALRPDGAQARSLALASGLVGASAALTVEHTAAHHLPLCQVAEILLPAALLNLALVMPIERWTPTRRRGLTAAATVVCVAAAGLNLLWFYERPELARSILLGAYVGTVLAAFGLIVNAASALGGARRAPRQRMQAAIVLASLLPGALVPGTAIAAFSLLGWTFSWTWAGATMPALALGLLYAVVRHDLLQAERLVRLTVGYTVVATVAVLGYAAGLATLQRMVPTGPVTESAAAFAFLVVAALSAEPLRRRVQTGIDRAFFRTRIDFARVLEDASTGLARLRDRAEIERYVSVRLCDWLSLEWARLCLGDEGAGNADRVEPVVFGSERLGEIACGPKRSGAPFSAAECELVRGLASQTALALHNADAIAALARAQEALLRAERLAAIGEFAGAVAHGIRNPLAGIRATAQVARRDAGEHPSAQAFAGVLSEVDRLDHRIRTLLDFSRPYAPRRERTDLRELVHAVAAAVDVQARGSGVDVVVEVPDQPVLRDIDAAYLEEAVLELAANGLRAMPDGGKLSLRLTADPAGADLVVADSGAGIPDGVRPRVFDLFFTTRDEGTGLGLASVKKIVESHGGEIGIRVTGPHGTSFAIRLP